MQVNPLDPLDLSGHFLRAPDQIQSMKAAQTAIVITRERSLESRLKAIISIKRQMILGPYSETTRIRE